MDAENFERSGSDIGELESNLRRYPLRRYLPQHQVHALLDQPSLVTAHPCDSHLNALLHAVSTYLPRYLVNEQLHDPKPGQVSGKFREATIMFADISGFTAMSERLSRRDEEGSEKITNIVGDYFTIMLANMFALSLPAREETCSSSASSLFG